MFEVTPSGQKVWEHSLGGVFIFHAHFVKNRLWADRAEISVAAGGRAQFDLIAGSEHAGRVYALAGSASGTGPGAWIGGVHLPLNVDAWTEYTLAVDPFPYAGNLGVLDGLGRGVATFDLPAGVLPPSAVGLELDHAFVVFDPATGGFVQASEARRLTLRR